MKQMRRKTQRIIAGAALSVLVVVLILWFRLAHEDTHNLGGLVVAALVIAWVLFAASLGTTGASYRAWRDFLLPEKGKPAPHRNYLYAFALVLLALALLLLRVFNVQHPRR